MADTKQSSESGNKARSAWLEDMPDVALVNTTLRDNLSKPVSLAMQQYLKGASTMGVQHRAGPCSASAENSSFSGYFPHAPIRDLI